jgi:hypothetical protein
MCAIIQHFRTKQKVRPSILRTTYKLVQHCCIEERQHDNYAFTNNKHFGGEFQNIEYALLKKIK